MKRKKVWIFCLVVCLVGCSGGKLRVIETKVISESEPFVKVNEKNIVIMNGNIPLSKERVEIYHGCDTTNEIKEMVDNDRRTFWISQSNGKGEIFLFPVYLLNLPFVKRRDFLPYSIDVLGGWGKNKNTYKRYNRPKRVKLELYLVRSHRARDQYEEGYLQGVYLIYQLVAELNDELGWHRLNIRMKPIEGYYLDLDIGGRLIIEDIYPGETNHVAISEIRFLYRETEK